ncbi:hypothetical protein, partial [Bradyrhizobium ottawaense]|uniref:hypothetical protein n=1 Tax=Bradyrhizobium ottawaense TaxID=931866 RepID=UPI0030C72473
MSTVTSAIRRLWWRRFLVLLAIIVVIALIAVMTSSQLGATIEALTPPGLPEPVSASERNW